MARKQSASFPDPEDRFTTIKVRESVRRWIKMRAAEEGVPMYALFEQLLEEAASGRPWESEA